MTLGQIAYQAYREFSSGKSLISGQQLPEWSDIPDIIQQAWEVSAKAVKDASS